MKNVMLYVLGFVSIFLLGWVIRLQSLAQDSVFAPREEALRRRVFEESAAYRQGMAQELQAMQLQYIGTSDPEAKAALAAVVRHRTAGYDIQNLPQNLQAFVMSLRLGVRGPSVLPGNTVGYPLP
jgi:hypothetical protein